MGKSETAVAETPGTAVGPATDYGEHEGQGFEKVTAEDLQLPFLSLLQDLSPQVKKAKPEYVTGAEPGMFHVSVSDKLFSGKDGVELVVADWEHMYTEWKPRDDGGGFLGVRSLDDSDVKEARAQKKFGKITTAHGTELIETYQLYVVVVPEGDGPFEFAVLPVTSTKIKGFRSWLTAVNGYKHKTADGKIQVPPIFAHRLRLTSVFTSAGDNDYHVTKFAPAAGSVVESLMSPDHVNLLEAFELRKLVQEGVAKVDYTTASTESDAAAGVM